MNDKNNRCIVCDEIIPEGRLVCPICETNAKNTRNKLVFEDKTIDPEKIREIMKQCKNRMDVSFYKYGPARENFATGRVDAYGCIDLCLEKFRKTHNNEYLLDVINYAIYRIMFPMPGEFFKPTDSGESAGTVGTPINME